VPFKYEGKAGTKERNKGCENLYWLTMQSGETASITADYFKDLAEENEAKKEDPAYQKHLISQGNIWPTVKPLELMRYLVKMVKMPGDNLILDPFMGSGTTMVACVLEDCGFLGIDMEDVAVRIAKARVDFAIEKGEAGYQ
jgi:DNA modification methylase